MICVLSMIGGVSEVDRSDCHSSCPMYIDNGCVLGKLVCELVKTLEYKRSAAGRHITVEKAKPDFDDCSQF